MNNAQNLSKNSKCFSIKSIFALRTICFRTNRKANCVRSITELCVPNFNPMAPAPHATIAQNQFQKMLEFSNYCHLLMF